MRKYIIIALMAICSASCSDMLDQTNPNYISVDDGCDSLSDTQSGLYAAYAAVRNSYVLNIRFEGFRGDLAYPGYGRPIPSSNATGVTWYTQTYTNSTSGIDDKWDGIYTAIWRANQVIEALNELHDSIDVTSDDQTTWEIQMGHAKFIRGLMYFYLYSSFNGGSVVLRESSVEAPSDFAKALSTPAEVRAFFLADLEEAYERLPKRSEQSTGYENLASKGAAATTLGTSYLYEGDYEKAIEMFEAVIESGEYELETDMEKLFTTAGEHNSESIFEITYSTEYRTDLGTWDLASMTNALNTQTTSTTSAPLPAAWLVYEYSNETIDKLNPINTEDRIANNNGISWRASQMVALVQDDRTPYYITDNAGYNCAIGGSYSTPTPNNGFGKLKKYSNHDICSDSEDTPSVSGKNVTVSRLADVYLMYAESILQQNDDIDGAIEYINKIRERWGLVLLGESNGDTSRTYDEINYDKDMLMEHIMFKERPLELSFEGHQIRWQDLIRWGLLEDDDNNIFRKRAQETYYAYDFQIVSLDGSATKKKINSAITTNEAIASASATSMHTIDYEFDTAATQYTKKTNQYLPIPLSEITANAALSE
ncbi:MAG: RagB/SusD family nutrient uptake outer membrane protein [Rikenellaceae bacterium]